MTRNPMMAKVHIARKDLGLDDEIYRSILTRITGQDSAKGLSSPQLDAVLKEFRRLGWKPKTPPKPAAPDSVDGKIRALWLSCYHLGAVQDGSETALRGFVKRQAKVDDLRFVRPGEAYKIIEALKAMAERAGVNWSEVGPPMADGSPPGVINPRCCVIRGQWRRLRALGALRLPEAADEDALCRWLHRNVTPAATSWRHLPPDQADKAIARLGQWIRVVMAKQKVVAAGGIANGDLVPG